MFSLYFDYYVISVTCMSRFGFEGRILVLIAPVPGHCIGVTLTTLFCNFVRIFLTYSTS